MHRGIAEIRFTVLGPLRAWRPDGTEIALGAPGQTAALAALLLRASDAVPVEELVDGLWNDEPPATAVGTIRTYIARLRKALAPHDVIQTIGDTYLLDGAAAGTDLAAAEQLIRRADDAAALPDPDAPAREAALLAEALGLWTGVPLAGLPGPFAARQRTRLAALRRDVALRQARARLRAGQAADAVADLTALAADHPQHEDVHELLMLALHRAGRRAEALAVFDDVRRLLDAELGVEPGPGLRGMRERILAGHEDPVDGSAPGSAAGAETGAGAGAAVLGTAAADGDGAAGAVDTGAADTGGSAGPAPSAAPNAAPVRPRELPATVPDFTGRGTEVRRIVDALSLARGRAVTVSAVAGMGGVGKSTLAIHVAHTIADRFPDGQLYVDLRGADHEPADPAAVLARFLTALGVDPAAVPADPAERAALFRTSVADRRILLLLDNAFDAAQVGPLLPGSPSCAVLVTGRARLAGLPTADTVDLDVLPLDEALTLLERVVGDARAAAEPEAAAELVTACARLPLAIRIVGARLAARPAWTLTDMLARLADERRQLTELRDGDVSIEACFAAGYRHLTVGPARAFRLLAVLDAADLSLTSAAAALGLGVRNTEDLLESLVDAALLESPAPGRYRFHDLVRVYARSVDADVAESGAVLARLLQHYHATSFRAATLVSPGRSFAALAGPPAVRPLELRDPAGAWRWADDEFDRILSAVRQTASASGADSGANVLHAVRAMVALQFRRADATMTEVRELARRLTEATAAHGDLVAESWIRCVSESLTTDGAEEAEADARRIIELARGGGDPATERHALICLGKVHGIRMNLTESLDCFAEARRQAEAAGDVETKVNALIGAACYRNLAGADLDLALADAREAVALIRAAGLTEFLSYGLYMVAWALFAARRVEEALAGFTECMHAADETGEGNQQSSARAGVVRVLLELGRPAEAIPVAEDALALPDNLYNDENRCRALFSLWSALILAGQDGPRAQACYDEAELIYLRREETDEFSGLSGFRSRAAQVREQAAATTPVPDPAS